MVPVEHECLALQMPSAADITMRNSNINVAECCYDVCALRLPYCAGIVRTLVIIFRQVIAGSLGFFIFKQQTTAWYFQDDITYGGARYIGTGRGFNITTNSFIKVFSNYARSHLYYGMELVALALVVAIASDCVVSRQQSRQQPFPFRLACTQSLKNMPITAFPVLIGLFPFLVGLSNIFIHDKRLFLTITACYASMQDCNYSALTWGTWLVAGSLILAPFWFNPMTFSMKKVKRDFGEWRMWLHGEIDPATGTNWHMWNR